MRILHLISDFRFTGPVEPVFTMVGELRKRGLDVRLAISKHPPERGRKSVVEIARERGLDPLLFNLSRYWSPLEWMADVRALRRYVEGEQIDLIHTHLSHDHHLGAAAAKRSKRRVWVIRTNHKARPLRPPAWLPTRVAMARTDACVEFSRAAAEDDQRLFRLAAERVFMINPVIDLERFNPDVPHSDVRASLGLDSSHVVAALVARVQRHRRWELLIEAVRLAHAKCPRLRVIVLGVGTHREEAAIQPAKRAGLGDVILFPGYRSKDYVDFLASIDFKILLHPGSDGTCRAVREALAMGKPAVVTRVGMLPELVPHDRAGLVVEPEPPALAAALTRMCEEPATRRRLAEGARAHALATFDPSLQTDALVSMYERLMAQLRA